MVLVMVLTALQNRCCIVLLALTTVCSTAVGQIETISIATPPVPTTTGAEGIGDTVGYQSVVGSYFEDASGGLLQEIYFRMAIEGSKQPQDFGVNAHLGGQG